MKKYPFLTVLLGIVSVAGMVMAWQWWKKRQNAQAKTTDPDSSNCNWSVTFRKSDIPLTEWVGIVTYARANWGVQEQGTGVVLSFVVSNETMKIIEPFVEAKGWKYEKERVC